jgi:8-oxo-dGTP pyrophosphatase MutT (NUDIX family)
MWLMTPQGFFSIVQKPDDAKRGTLTVRARVASDLDNLRNGPLPALGPTIFNAGTDYAARAIAPRQDVANALAELVMSLDYANFKTEVAKRQGAHRAHVYGRVWHELYELQSSQPSIAKAGSYGGVLIDDDGKVLLREVSGHFGNYVWTFAKGRPDPGEAPHETSLREVEEETGYRASIIGSLPGAYGGSTVSTAFFVMRPEGEPGPFSDETAAVEWFSFSEAAERIKLTTTPTGRARDLRVLADVQEWLISHRG